MQQNNKIQAFTISEVIVVLILTGIVVGLAFSVLTLVQKHMMGIQQNFNTSVEINKLETSLWIDFNRYPRIEFDDGQQLLKFASQMDSIVYQIQNEKIIKATDTFNISTEPILYFRGKEVTFGKIDAIKLKTGEASLSQILFIFKENDALNLMN